MKISYVIVAVLISVCSFAVTVEPAAKPVEIPLRYVDVATAYELLRKAAPDDIGAVESILIQRNTIVLQAGHPGMAAIREYLHTIDEQPKQLKLEMTVFEVDDTGKEKILSRPSIYMLDGGDAEIVWEEPDGKKRKIKVNASSVDSTSTD